MKERKLSKREQQRKAEFDKLIEQMKQNNYEINKLTIGVGYANVMGLVIMLPFVVLFYLLFTQVNPNISFVLSLTECFIFLCLIPIFMVLHEMIHGILFARYAKHRFQSVDFGIIWKMFIYHSFDYAYSSFRIYSSYFRNHHTICFIVYIGGINDDRWRGRFFDIN